MKNHEIAMKNYNKMAMKILWNYNAFTEWLTLFKSIKMQWNYHENIMKLLEIPNGYKSMKIQWNYHDIPICCKLLKYLGKLSWNHRYTHTHMHNIHIHYIHL